MLDIYDNEDKMIDRLDRLVRVLEAKEFGGTNADIDKTVNNNVTKNVTNTVNQDLTEPTDNNTPNYFTTGAKPLAVDSAETWQRLDFGLVAETVNIRTTDDIDIAFKNPNNNSSTVIRVRGNESPFTIGGDAGIESAFLWIKEAATASDTPGIQIIAFN